MVPARITAQNGSGREGAAILTPHPIPETTPNPKNAVNRLLRGKGRAKKSRKSGF